MPRSVSRWTVVVGLAVVGCAAFFAIRSLTRDRVDDISAKVHWPSDCSSIERNDRVRWPTAQQSANVFCEAVGPFFVYARFENAQVLERALLTQPPSAPTCIAGDEVILDGLEGRDFATICSDLDGRVIDAVTALGDVPCSDCDTMDGNDRAATRQERRDTTAQHRALLKYFTR